MSADGGGDIDILLPALRFETSNTLRLQGMKCAIRARYSYDYKDSQIIKKDIFNSDYEEILLRTKMMDNHLVSAGPVINLVFIPTNHVNCMINMYALYGQMIHGRLSAGFAVMDSNLLLLRLAGMGNGLPYLNIPPIMYTPQLNKTRYSGYSFKSGIGPHFALYRSLPLVLGVNVIYTYSVIKLERYIPLYFSMHRKFINHSWGGEVSIGFYF